MLHHLNRKSFTVYEINFVIQLNRHSPRRNVWSKNTIIH
jgi:hypothetical protein